MVILFILWLNTAVTMQGVRSASTFVDFYGEEDGSGAQLEKLEILSNSSLYAPWHLRAAMAEKLQSVFGEELGEEDTRIAMLELIDQEIEQEMVDGNANARTYFTYCRMYRYAERFKNAEEMCQRAVSLAPQTQAVLIELGEVYRDRGEFEDSLDILKGAYELQPEYDTARLQYAAALIYAEEEAVSRELLTERYGKGLIDEELIISAYVHIDELSTAQGIIQEHIVKNPNDIGYRVSEIGLYVMMEKPKQAKRAVRKLMEQGIAYTELGFELMNRIDNGGEIVGTAFILR